MGPQEGRKEGGLPAGLMEGASKVWGDVCVVEGTGRGVDKSAVDSLLTSMTLPCRWRYTSGTVGYLWS
jgi:hypothetical protein